MKVLLTTITIDNISPTARAGGIRKMKTDTPQECFNALNNIEYINGFTLPNYATRFIKENVPSIDILEYPTVEEYEKAVRGGYDVVALSFWTYTYYEAINMARIAREAGVREIWGGGHGVSTPGAEKYFDRILSGYSEYELKYLIEGETLEYTKHPVMDSDFDFFLENQKTGYLFSIRGCRMKCSFCSGPGYYKKLDTIPIEEIERVLDIYVKKDIRHITLVDETFLQDREHARKVIEKLRERNLSWGCTSRVDILLGKIEELKRYGLKNVYVGIESLNDESLKYARKGERSIQTIRLFEELKRKGDSFAFGTYIIALEGDTEETIKSDVERLGKYDALYGVVFWIATPFPGTVFYDEYDEKGLINDKNWRNYDALNLVFSHRSLTKKKARDMLSYCVRNHCHESNIRKYKILKKWEKMERDSTLRHPVTKTL